MFGRKPKTKFTHWHVVERGDIRALCGHIDPHFEKGPVLPGDTACPTCLSAVVGLVGEMSEALLESHKRLDLVNRMTSVANATSLPFDEHLDGVQRDMVIDWA